MRAQTLAVVVVVLFGPAAQAQSDAVHRTTLQEQQFPEPSYHTITVKTVVDPGGTVAAHTHPGAEMAYVESGSATLTLEAMPPRQLSTGDSFSIEQGKVHTTTNAGAGPLTVISTYVVERGRPVAIPVQ